jgi:hypothetical protein
MTGTQQLLTVAREYARATNRTLGTVSFLALGDGKRLKEIEGGADITTGRLERTLAWFSDNWPPEGVWPAEVARPWMSA